MPVVATFGEIMMRLKPAEFLRFTQADSFEVTYGGGEANVAMSLAHFGIDARFISAVPANDLGQACINSLRQWGVDTRFIARQGNRLGIYFLEGGAVQRPSKVIYDRAGASIAEAKSGDIDWAKVFSGVQWFHWTGITPAISETAAALCLEGILAAKSLGITVSCDLNFRKNLWKWGRSAQDVMPELVQHCDVAIGNEEDADKVFGIKAHGVDVDAGHVEAEAYTSVAQQLMARFPALQKVAITLRGSKSASHNTWSGVLFDGAQLWVGPDFEIMPIVDRVGGGDSFAAGLIYSMLHEKDAQAAINFAVAASCLKHTITGDVNLVTVSEVEALLKEGGSGRVQR